MSCGEHEYEYGDEREEAEEEREQEQRHKFGPIVINIYVSDAIIEKAKALSNGRIIYNDISKRFTPATASIDDNKYFILAEHFNKHIYERALERAFNSMKHDDMTKLPIGTIYDIEIELNLVENMFLEAHRIFTRSQELRETYENEILPKINVIDDSEIYAEIRQKIDSIVEQLKHSNIDINEAKKQLVEQTKDMIIDALVRYVEKMKEQLEEDEDDYDDEYDDEDDDDP